MPSRRAVLATIAATAATPIGLDACSHPAPKPAAPARDDVTYLTGFVTPREDYPYVGQVKGLFAEAGINVEIKPGAPSDANLTSVAAGQADFAAIDCVSAYRGARNFPMIRVVAAVQHTTLLSLITLEGRGIARPMDLVGKTIATAPAAATQTLFPTYARLAGVDAHKVKIVNGASTELPVWLASGRVDAIGSYAVDTPNIRNAAHENTVVLPYSDYIGDLYGTVLITTTELLSAKPDLVRRFAGALVKSVRYSVAHTQEAGTAVHQKLPTVGATIVDQTMTLMKPYVTTATLEPGRVMQGITLLEAAGLAPSGLQPQDVVDFSVAGVN